MRSGSVRSHGGSEVRLRFFQALQHREEHIALADQLVRLKQENCTLLSSISKANRAQNPVNPRSLLCGSLNHFIQSSVAGMFKWSCKTELSIDAISLLDAIHPCGKCTLPGYDENV